MISEDCFVDNGLSFFNVPIILAVLRYTSSNYTFVIFKLLSVVRIARSFVCFSEECFVDDGLSLMVCPCFNVPIILAALLRLLATPLVSSNC